MVPSHPLAVFRSVTGPPCKILPLTRQTAPLPSHRLPWPIKTGRRTEVIAARSAIVAFFQNGGDVRQTKVEAEGGKGRGVTRTFNGGDGKTSFYFGPATRDIDMTTPRKLIQNQQKQDAQEDVKAGTTCSRVAIPSRVPASNTRCIFPAWFQPVPIRFTLLTTQKLKSACPKSLDPHDGRREGEASAARWTTAAPTLEMSTW